MIPILLGLGVAAAGVFSVASHEVIKDTKNEIEGINERAQSMIDETKQLIKDTDARLNEVYGIAAKQKKDIYETTLKRAQEVTKRIKIKQENLEFKNEIVAINSSISSIETATLPKVANAAALGLTYVISNSAGFIVGGFLGNTIVGVAMEFKLDEAKEQYSKIKVECEAAKTQCSKRKNLTRNIADTVNVVHGLDELTKKSLSKVENILNRKGTDMSKWTESEEASVKALFNLVKATSDIINSDIVTSNGNMSTKYRDKIKEQKNMMINKGLDVPVIVVAD